MSACVLPALGGVQLANIYARLTGTAGKCMGPCSTLNNWVSAVGNVYNWQNNRYFGTRYWRVAGSTNNQTLWACNTGATKGWRLILGNDRSTNLFFSGALRNFNAATYLGCNDLLVGQDNTGQLIASQNGLTGLVFAAPGAYTAADGTSLQSFGWDASSVNFGATQTVFLQHYVLDINMTPTQMGAITGSVNALDCWNLSRFLRSTNVGGYIGAPTALYDWQLWDGAAATFTGSGGGAFLFTRTGTGGGQHTFPAWDRQRFPPKSYFFSGRYEYYENGARRGSLFNAAKFTTDAVDTTNGPGGLGCESYGKNLAIVGNNVAGFSVNGTNIALGNNIMCEQDVFDVNRAVSLPGVVAGAAKPVVLTATLQSEVTATGEVKPNAQPQAVRMASSATVTMSDAFAAPPADLQLIVGDSLIQEVLGLTDVTGVKGPPVNSALGQIRTALVGGREVRGEGWGFGNWFERISTDAQIANFVDVIVRQSRGTSTNWNRIMLDSNDAFLNLWVLQTTFRTRLDLFITAWKARKPTGGKLQLISATSYVGVGGSTPNASGWLLTDFATTLNAAVTAAADADITFLDAVGAVSGANKPDNKHYNTAGGTELRDFYATNTPP